MGWLFQFLVKDAEAELQKAPNSWTRVVGPGFMDQTYSYPAWHWISDTDSQEMRLYHYTCS